MNIYDKANELVQAIKQSEEYKNMDIAQKRLNEKPEHMQMVKDFMKTQINIQTMTMLKQDIDEDTKEAFNALYTTVMNIENCRKFLEAQNVYGRMVQDIYKIIGEASDVMGELFGDIIPGM
jgi:cell fate (sporulation/competence/biofilm development) regulator YlbF (YheA/YmcA/DUF963 family)